MVAGKATAGDWSLTASTSGTQSPPPSDDMQGGSWANSLVILSTV
ncbi:unnamed protein product [Musa acuminata subsp. burmannicoides]